MASSSGGGRSAKALRAAALVGAITIVALALPATPASAVFSHPVVKSSFGPDGTSGTSFAEIANVAVDSSRHRLYAVTKGPTHTLYAFDTGTPGVYTPLNSGNGFPHFPLEIAAATEEPDIAVDETSGNIYYVSGTLYAYSMSGEALFSTPQAVSGFPCGVEVDAAGNVWTSSQSGKFREYLPTGGNPIYTFTVPPNQEYQCDLVFDPANGDLYSSRNTFDSHPRGVFRYSAPDFTSSSLFINGFYGRMAIDPVTRDIYATGSPITVYDQSGAVVENFPNVGGLLVRSIAVDWSTGVVYAAERETARVLAIPGVYLPDLITSAPTDFATLHGQVELGGGKEVTQCSFQWGTNTNYSGGSTSCTPAIPPNYSGPTAVSADLTGLVTPETLYHYRLVASNADGTNFSSDQTFTPHYVAGLKPDPATAITRVGATLNADYLGTGEDTHYYFEWGTVCGVYGSQSAVPPGDDDGTHTGPHTLAFTIPAGLAPDTTYCYRVVGSNPASEGAGKVTKSDPITFTTLPAVPGLSTDSADPGNEGADLHGSFTGENAEVKYFFEYGTTTAYGSHSTLSALPSPNGATPVTQNVGNLRPNRTYHYRFVAINSFGTTFGQDKTFTTTSPPVVIGTSTSDPSGSAVTLHAVVNPEGFDTLYHFEYGQTPAYGSQAPASSVLIPAGEANVNVSVHVGNLDGGTYHFRVVATSVKGEAASADQSFNFYPPSCPNSTVRQQTGANTLPDCRAYELVSPEDAGITLIMPANAPFSPTATSPSRLDFIGEFGSVAGVGEPLNVVADNYVATRTAQGWKTKYVGLPASKAFLPSGPPWTLPGAYEPDKWLTDTLTDTALSRIVQWDDGYPVGTEYEYVRHAGASNAPYIFGSNTGKQVDRWPTNLGSVPGGEAFEGHTEASADLSHFVFTSDIPFAPGGAPGDMYDNDVVARELRVINLKEDGTRILGAQPVELSADGSHILMTVGGARGSGEGFFSRKTSGPGELIMRVNDAVTYQLAPGHAVNYVAMTPDGKKVYFTSAQDLTDDGGDTDTSLDLYLWNEANPGHLTLVSTGNDSSSGNTDTCSASWTAKCGVEPISISGYAAANAGAGGNPYSDNSVAPESGDIYFLSPENLDGPNGVAGWENLYLYRGGSLRFVAALDPQSKACTYQQGEVCADSAVARIETNADGSAMAFLTGSKVTEYDNAGHTEMYLYGPASDQLTCVSCLPNGKSPSSDVLTSHNGRFITEGGAVFFETEDPLVAQDTNRATDVYEYVDGRPQLITTGTNVGNKVGGIAGLLAAPGLVGVSASGLDVYFATYDVLVGQDRNGEALKIYDARTGGGFQFSPPVPPCVAADECHGPSSEEPVPPYSGTTPGLGTTGNLKPSGQKKNRSQAVRRRRHHKRHRKAQHSARHTGVGGAGR